MTEKFTLAYQVALYANCFSNKEAYNVDLQTEIKNLQGEVKISRWNLSSSRVQITLAVPPPPLQKRVIPEPK